MEHINGYVCGNLVKLQKQNNNIFSYISQPKRHGVNDFDGREYSLHYVLKKNKAMYLSGEVIYIDLIKTFNIEQQELDYVNKHNEENKGKQFYIPASTLKTDNFNLVLEELKNQYMSIKIDLGIATSDKYKVVLEYNKKVKVDIYLLWLEETIEEFESFERPEYVEVLEEKTDEEIKLEELIEEAKGLGINLGKGKKTIKSVQKKIDDFNLSTETTED